MRATDQVVPCEVVKFYACAKFYASAKGADVGSKICY